MKPLWYGPYSIVEAMGNNAFQLDLPPYWGLHPVFNFDLFKLGWRSDIEDQLSVLECVAVRNNNRAFNH